MLATQAKLEVKLSSAIMETTVIGYAGFVTSLLFVSISKMFKKTFGPGKSSKIKAMFGRVVTTDVKAKTM